MVRGNVALEGEFERVVGDDEVQPGIEASPPPHVLTIGVESSSASEALSVESLFIEVLGSFVDARVQPQECHPSCVVGAAHPGIGNNPV